MSGSDGLGRIVLTSRLPGVAFSVVDGGFQPVGRGVGRLSVDLPHGIYEVITRAGGSVESELVSLAPGETWARHDVTMSVYTATPLATSRNASDAHAAAARRASAAVSEASGSAGTSGLVLVLRSMDPSAGLHVDQLALLDRRLEPVPGWPGGWEVDAAAGVAGIGSRLPPGPYVLRLTQPAGAGPPLDQTLWLSDDWQTVAFCPDGTEQVDLGNATVHLTRLTEPFRPDEDSVGAALEIAMSGLRQGLPLVSDDLLALLHGKFVNPMLGIVGAHALLLDPALDLDRYRGVVDELRHLVPDHPDVIALARHPAYVGDGVDPGPVWWPPMLAASYHRLLLPADQRDPRVIADDSPAERVAGYIVQRGPWLCWEASPAILTPATDVPPDDTIPISPPQARSATTKGAVRRIERHVGELADLTGSTRHQVAASLGVEELARRLDLPNQTVRVALKELGWTTVFIPIPAPGPVPAPEPTPEPAPRPPDPGPGRPWGWLVAGLATAAAVVGALVWFGAGEDGPDLEVGISGDASGRPDRRFTPVVDVHNNGPDTAHPVLRIVVPAGFELAAAVPGCRGQRELVCTVGISAGGHVPVQVPVRADGPAVGTLRATIVSDIGDVDLGNNTASVRIEATRTG